MRNVYFAGGLCASALLIGCNSGGRPNDHAPVVTTTEQPMQGRTTLGMPISVLGRSTVIVPFSIEERKGLLDDKDPYSRGGYPATSDMRFMDPSVNKRYSWNSQTSSRWHNAIIRDLSSNQEWTILDRRGVIAQYTMMLNTTVTPMRGDVVESVTSCQAILFIATVDDTNGDGSLNDLDANVAILAEGDGRNPRPISPPRAQVWESRFDEETQQVYLLVVSDTNGDGRFSTDDEPVPYALPISGAGMAQPVVSETMLKRVEGLLD